MAAQSRTKVGRYSAVIALVLLAACGSGSSVVSRSSPTPASTLLADTWTFDGKAWSQDNVSGPPPRATAAMAFDEKRGVTVLFGGVSTSGLLDDTWTFDGRAWTEQHPAHHPGVRQGASMGYDPKSQRVILFGGDVSEPVTVNETWAWDGGDWAQLETNGVQIRSGAALVYDAGRGSLVLIGGSLANVTFYADEWVWDGARWHALTGSHPPPVAHAAVAYDPSRSELVLFGGTVHSSGGPGTIGDAVGDTWVEQGNLWTKASPATGPSPRYSSVSAFDPELGQVVLFGGAACPALDDGFWSWDGQNWTDARGPVEPSARFAASAVYDSVRHTVILFGGSREKVCY